MKYLHSLSYANICERLNQYTLSSPPTVFLCCRLACCCRVVLEKMHPEADAAFAKHNDSALQSIKVYATKALAGQTGDHSHRLPFSGLEFASSKENEWSAALSAAPEEGSILAFLSSHQVSSTVCSPFAALSGESAGPPSMAPMYL